MNFLYNIQWKETGWKIFEIFYFPGLLITESSSIFLSLGNEIEDFSAVAIFKNHGTYNNKFARQHPRSSYYLTFMFQI